MQTTPLTYKSLQLFTEQTPKYMLFENTYGLIADRPLTMSQTGYPRTISKPP